VKAQVAVFIGFIAVVKAADWATLSTNRGREPVCPTESWLSYFGSSWNGYLAVKGLLRPGCLGVWLRL
jgi:hypothetical protein